MFAPEPDEVISKGRTVQHHAVSAAWVLFAGAAGRSSLAAVLGQIAGEDPVVDSGGRRPADSREPPR